MVRAWLMDDSKEDQRLPHQREPPHPIPLDTLQQITGVEYFQVLYYS